MRAPGAQGEQAPQMDLPNTPSSGREEEQERMTCRQPTGPITSEGQVEAQRPHPTQASSLTCATGTAVCVWGPKSARGRCLNSISMAPWGQASRHDPQPLQRSSFTSGSSLSSSSSRSISPSAPSTSRGSHLSARGCLMKPTWYRRLPHFVGDHEAAAPTCRQRGSPSP